MGPVAYAPFSKTEKVHVQAGPFLRGGCRTAFGEIRYSMIVKRMTIVRSTIFLLWIIMDAAAYVQGYLPLTEQELSLRFPQHVVRKQFLPLMGSPEVVKIGSATVRFLAPDTNTIQFSGKDSAGKPWTVAANGWMGGALYTADLDHNGMTDIIYASYTGGNGWAPPMHVLTLLFETNGRPTVSEMDGYFETDGRGLKDLLDLDGDGKAELLRQSFDNGYWITSLYEAQDAHWHIVRGQHAARRYPLYTRFTNRPNRVPTTPAPGRHPIEDDLSNDIDKNGPTLRLERLQWADVQQSGQPKLHFSDSRDCVEIGWYSTAAVVLDAPERRVAATLGAPEQARQLLDTIVRDRIPVSTAGSRRDRAGTAKPGWCSVEMIWASSPKPP